MENHDNRPEPANHRDPEKGVLPADPEAIKRALVALRPYLLHVANQGIDSGLESKAGASDLVNDTLVAAQQVPEKFEGRSSGEMRAWLIKALRGRISNLIRDFRVSGPQNVAREVSIDQGSTDGGRGMVPIESTLSPSGQAIRKEEQEWVNAALDRLEERDRQVVIWRNHENHPWDEIGKRLGGSEEMARKVWTRALVKLRHELGEPPDSLSDIRPRP